MALRGVEMSQVYGLTDYYYVSHNVSSVRL
jgi:hypothetical protein